MKPELPETTETLEFPPKPAVLLEQVLPLDDDRDYDFEFDPKDWI